MRSPAVGSCSNRTISSTGVVPALTTCRSQSSVPPTTLFATHGVRYQALPAASSVGRHVVPGADGFVAPSTAPRTPLTL
ncbi:Uncharacterised protein [Mycobacteroides abscessus]|nr:Uncharacterised protein [Mycobacteroides abscessus]